MSELLPALAAITLCAAVVLAAVVDEVLSRRRVDSARRHAVRRVRFIEQETNRQLVELLRSRSPRR